MLKTMSETIMKKNNGKLELWGKIHNYIYKSDL